MFHHKQRAKKPTVLTHRFTKNVSWISNHRCTIIKQHTCIRYNMQKHAIVLNRKKNLCPKNSSLKSNLTPTSASSRNKIQERKKPTSHFGLEVGSLWATNAGKGIMEDVFVFHFIYRNNKISKC
ncbi:hypothetical protein R6Q59_011505 [Mikania micrantha]